MDKRPVQPSLFEPEQIPVTKTRKERRNDAIRADFENYTKKQHKDANWAVDQLGEKYYLENDTIWRILWGVGYYKKK